MPVEPTIDSRAAGLFLRRRTGPTWSWLLLQATGHGEWGFPKGHLNRGEGCLHAALRECAEETGIGLLALDSGHLHLDYRLLDGRLKRVFYFGAETGQTAVILSEEHVACRWCPLETTLVLLGHANLRTLFQHHVAMLITR
jgi:tRNA nucleotidyltransferase (CCA-adding enzyme)